MKFYFRIDQNIYSRYSGCPRWPLWFSWLGGVRGTGWRGPFALMSSVRRRDATKEWPEWPTESSRRAWYPHRAPLEENSRIRATLGARPNMGLGGRNHQCLRLLLAGAHQSSSNINISSMPHYLWISNNNSWSVGVSGDKVRPWRPDCGTPKTAEERRQAIWWLPSRLFLQSLWSKHLRILKALQVLQQMCERIWSPLHVAEQLHRWDKLQTIHRLHNVFRCGHYVPGNFINHLVSAS